MCDGAHQRSALGRLHFARPHVEELNVNVGMRLFVSRNKVLEHVLAVRRVDGKLFPRRATARREKSQRENYQQTGCFDCPTSASHAAHDSCYRISMLSGAGALDVLKVAVTEMAQRP